MKAKFKKNSNLFLKILSKQQYIENYLFVRNLKQKKLIIFFRTVPRDTINLSKVIF